jgi:hypothetical protein
MATVKPAWCPPSPRAAKSSSEQALLPRKTGPLGAVARHLSWEVRCGVLRTAGATRWPAILSCTSCTSCTSWRPWAPVGVCGTSGPATANSLRQAIQAARVDAWPILSLEVARTAAYHTGLTGLISSSIPVFWNVEKR